MIHFPSEKKINHGSLKENTNSLESTVYTCMLGLIDLRTFDEKIIVLELCENFTHLILAHSFDTGA